MAIWPTINSQTAELVTAQNTAGSSAGNDVYRRSLELQLAQIQRETETTENLYKNAVLKSKVLESKKQKLRQKYEEVLDVYGEKRKYNELVAQFGTNQRIQYKGKTILASLASSVAVEDQNIRRLKEEIAENRENQASIYELLALRVKEIERLTDQMREFCHRMADLRSCRSIEELEVKTAKRQADLLGDGHEREDADMDDADADDPDIGATI